MKINDSEITNLINRAKNYRNGLSSSLEDFRNIIDLEELQSDFQKGEFNIEDERNVFVECKITEEELTKGSTKIIKYNQINEVGKKKENEILLKIPQNIKEGQKIILHNQGNYIKEENKWSHLIVEMSVLKN